MCFQNCDQLHDSVDSDPHRVQIKDVRVLLGIDLVEALLEHLGLLEIWFFSSVLATGEEDICFGTVVPACISSSKMEQMRLVSTCCSCTAFLERGLYIVLFFI